MRAPSDHRAPSLRAHHAGDLLDGRYRLVARLGQGGFGDVWRADELLPDGALLRQAALKLLISGGDDAVDWGEEAKLLASFRHPSLVTIYAAGILDGAQRFVAMELLEGQNLAEVGRARGPIGWRRVLGWAMSAAAALDLIHAAGVVHLDLKPANLFLCADGALKVLDFGIARRAGVEAVVAHRGERLGRDAGAAGGRDAELATGLFIAEREEASHDAKAFASTRPVATSERRVAIGTPGFMAPEVLELADPTAAADAYALAVCAVQLVTGHLPHAAPDEPLAWDDPTAVSEWLDEVRRATLRGALRAEGDDARLLPRGFAALLRRLLAVDPVQRGVVPGKLRALFEEVWERPHGVPDPPYFTGRPYPAEAEGLLFGRDDDITRLGRELEYEPCVVLHGAAGSGKSSLIGAGIVPYLGRRGVDGKDDWIAVHVAPAPGIDPDAALAAALVKLDPDLAEAGAAELSAHCAQSSLGVVLVLDPLEETVRAGGSVTMEGHSPPARSRLEALVTGIAAGPAIPGLRLLGALGEEETAALLASPVGSAVRAALRYVGGPATAAVTDIVARPAHCAGVAVLGAEIVAGDVLRELRAGGGRLPFVALALEEWWRGARSRANVAAGQSGPPSRGELQGDRWRETGGVGGAVVRHAERVVAALDAEARHLAEEILLRLAATDGAEVRWDEGELVGAVAGHNAGLATPREETKTRAVLARLAQEHIVRIGRDGATSVQIGHEALLKDWPRLASARLAQMDRLLLLERVREARIAWERADNHGDFLLHGALLKEISARPAWLDRGLGPADRTFLRASRRRARFRSARRVAAAGFVVLSLGGSAAGKHVVDEARGREARARAAAVEMEVLAELAAKARRSEDPYYRATLLSATQVRGSTDGMLPLDLLVTTVNLARADFVTLEHIAAPSFPWDDRFLLGSSSAGTITLLDFRPPEPDVIEDADLDADPAALDAAHVKKPALTHLRPFDVPVVERVDLAFDTAFATRSSGGAVEIFRLRDDGRPALAAVAPMRCIGPMQLAAAAPVLVCGTDHGVARWDFSRKATAGAVVTHPFQGDVADVSADGERIAAIAGKEVLFWSPMIAQDGGDRGSVTYVAPRPVSLVRLAPRGPAAALLEGTQVEIVDARRLVFTITPQESRAVGLRWDEGGVDLAVCDALGGRWYYLRHGGRAKDDPAPRGEPCVPPRPRGQPEPIASAESAADLADRDWGNHPLDGGWKLRGHRYLTRDLVVLDAAGGRSWTALPGDLPPAAARLLRFEGRDDIGSEEAVAPGDSVAAVERDDTLVMLQIGEEMRFYGLPEGTRLFTRKGNFLRRCADGRWLAWEVDGPSYRVFDAWQGSTVRAVPREPGFVLGAGSACHVLYTQRLDGTLAGHPLDGRPQTPGHDGGSRPQTPVHELGAADGYVFDARPSASRGLEHGGSGLLLAFSSGAVARIDDATRSLRLLGYATPRATAIADGPRPGEVIFADGTGVIRLGPGAPPEWLREGNGLLEWSDLSASPDGTSILLAAPDRVAALDVRSRELLGSIPVPGRDRLARWDDEGSALLWSYDRKGGPEGLVIPRGVSLARRVAEAVSNLEVERGRVAIHK